MCDGIALEGMALVLKYLPLALRDGHNLLARERLLLAASMGATAFQKGLGMIHSIAHALGGECDLHHGTAISLVMPWATKFVQEQSLTSEQSQRLERVQELFNREGRAEENLWESIRRFTEDCGIEMGLRLVGIPADRKEVLVDKAFGDPCHPQGIIDVSRKDLETVLEWSM